MAGGAAPVPVLRAALANRCPRCGKGRLYEKLLDVVPVCESCGLKLGSQDAADGPAVFVILILGFIIVGLALVTEAVYAPPLWVHAIIWLPLILAMSWFMLRFVKSLLIALQFKHRAHDYENEDGGQDV